MQTEAAFQKTCKGQKIRTFQKQDKKKKSALDKLSITVQ